MIKKSSHSPLSSSAASYPDPQDEPQDLSLAHNTLSNKQEHPSRSSSPLQQMQNITNQFLSNSQAHLLQQKPLKHVLPPISQDQFDRYTGLNTEDLVKKVSLRVAVTVSLKMCASFGTLGETNVYCATRPVIGCFAANWRVKNFILMSSSSDLETFFPQY